jgi:translocation and assembly module TamB
VDGEQEEPIAKTAPRRRRFRKRQAAYLATGAIFSIAVILWLQRIAISETLIEQELADRGISATYKIEAIGVRTQRLTNLVVGKGKIPDLTAKSLEITLDWGWRGPVIQSVSGEGVRLHGKYQDGKVSFGELDKFSDPESKEPFKLPDFNLRLRDSRLSMITPWGAIGASLAGDGNLRRNFKSKMALSIPQFEAAGCSAKGGNFWGDVRIRNAQPRIIGPLKFDGLACDNGQAHLGAWVANIDSRISEDMSRWNGLVSLNGKAVRFGAIAGDRVVLATAFNGNARTTHITAKGETLSVQSPQLSVPKAGLKLRGYVGSGKQMLDGSIDFFNASVTSALRRQIADAAKGAVDTPIGPIAAQAGDRAAAALEDFSGRAQIEISSEKLRNSVHITGLALRSASGAMLSSASGGALRLRQQPSGFTWSGDGKLALQGGGLPQLTAQLQRRDSNRFSAQIEMQPYAAGSAQLAMTPLTLDGAPGQPTRFQTQLRFSGPLADGRVEDALIPIAGRMGDSGVIALNGGCHAVSATEVRISGYQLAQPQLQLCSAAGQDLMRWSPRGLEGAVILPRLALNGSSGDSALALNSGPARYDLRAGQWSVQDLALQLTPKAVAGQPEELPTHFAATEVKGRLAASGLQGTLSGLEGRIGAVPLNMSEVDGDWLWRDGALSVAGQLVLTDAEADARFFPLIAKGATLRFADGRITALAAFAERGSGRHVVNTDIVHDFNAGGGRANLHVKELRFDEAFQPTQLTSLALGVVAEVDGSVVGDGFVQWDNKGVTSGGTFATEDTNLAAAFGPVTGLTGTIVFDDLLDLRTRPAQRLTIKEVNPGIAVTDGEITYMLTGGNKVRIEGGRWPLANGELKLHPATLNFAAEETRHLSFDIIGIDAAHLLQQFAFENLNVTGIFDGSLPVEFDGLGGHVVGGRIDSRAGGGTIEYVGELSNRNLGAMANFAFGALRSLTYNDLSIELNGALDGEMVTDIRFGGVGQGQGANKNFLTRQIARIPMIFNVKVAAPFRSLFTTVAGLYDPTVQIEEKLPELVRRQNELLDERLGQDSLVQPLASEPVR